MIPKLSNQKVNQLFNRSKLSLTSLNYMRENLRPSEIKELDQTLVFFIGVDGEIDVDGKRQYDYKIIDHDHTFESLSKAIDSGVLDKTSIEINEQFGYYNGRMFIGHDLRKQQ